MAAGASLEADLQHAMPFLSGSDVTEATTIAESAKLNILTLAQAKTAEKLITRAHKRMIHTPRGTVQLGDISKLTKMFDTALRRSKEASVVIAQDRTTIFRFKSVDPASTKLPGTVDVVHGRQDVWYGRVLLDGTFSMSREQTPEAVQSAVEALLVFTNDPMGTAKRSCDVTGRCCLCDEFVKEDSAEETKGIHEACGVRFGLYRRKA